LDTATNFISAGDLLARRAAALIRLVIAVKLSCIIISDENN